MAAEITTQLEYDNAAADLFKEYDIPDEFQSALSYRAYETGHAYGYSECLIHLEDLASGLSQAIQEYTARITREALY